MRPPAMAAIMILVTVEDRLTAQTASVHRIAHPDFVLSELPWCYCFHFRSLNITTNHHEHAQPITMLTRQTIEMNPDERSTPNGALLPACTCAIPHEIKPPPKPKTTIRIRTSIFTLPPSPTPLSFPPHLLILLFPSLSPPPLLNSSPR